MRESGQIRYQLFLPKTVSERFEQLAGAPGASKSKLLATALDAWLNRRGANELDERFGLRLDRISNQLARIERDGHIQIESLALFIRYMLTINAPLAEEDEVSRAIGRDRFAAFVTRVGQQLAGGRRTFVGEEER